MTHYTIRVRAVDRGEHLVFRWAGEYNLGDGHGWTVATDHVDRKGSLWRAQREALGALPMTRPCTITVVEVEEP